MIDAKTRTIVARLFDLAGYIQSRKFGVTAQDIVHALPDWYDDATIGLSEVNAPGRKLYRDLEALELIMIVHRDGSEPTGRYFYEGVGR